MELDYIWDTRERLLDNLQESNSINNPWKRKQVIWCRTTELKILWKEWILRILESYSLFLLKIKVTPPPFKWMRWNEILFLMKFYFLHHLDLLENWLSPEDTASTHMVTIFSPTLLHQWSNILQAQNLYSLQTLGLLIIIFQCRSNLATAVSFCEDYLHYFFIINFIFQQF